MKCIILPFINKLCSGIGRCFFPLQIRASRRPSRCVMTNMQQILGLCERYGTSSVLTIDKAFVPHPFVCQRRCNQLR